VRPPRPETRALIDQLEARPVAGAPEDRADIVDAIGATGDPAAIEHLLPLLVDRGPIAGSALSAIARLLADQPCETYPELERLRCVGSEWGRWQNWHSTTPRDVARLSQLPEGWAAVGIASVHRDGHVREAAVRALSWRDEPGGLEIPFLVLRMNDWVAQVRGAARTAMEARLSAHHADGLLRALPLILALKLRRRDDHRSFVDAVLALLGSPPCRPALLRGTLARDRAVRRGSFRLALGAETVDLDLLHRALSDDDLVVRAEAAADVGRVTPGDQRRLLLERALRDPTSLVRRRAVRLIAGEPLEWRKRLLDELLTDSTPMVRMTARAELARISPGFDAAARYREVLSSPARLRGAILGLGECGCEEDVLLLWPFLSERRVKLRAAATRSTARLDPQSVGPLVDALADPSKRISRVAASLLQRRPRTGLHELVLTAAERSGIPSHARVHALDVICSALPWTRLLSLLEAARSASLELAKIAATRIDAHTIIPPTADEAAAVERALEGSPLPPGQKESIRKELLFWRAARRGD
jgi:HEAT repeat protein